LAVKTYLDNDEILVMIGRTEFLRDKVILTFLSDVGCRVSELLSIKAENIDLERREVLIPHLKRGVKKKCPKCERTCGGKQKFCVNCGADLKNVKPEGIIERSRLVNFGDGTARLLREYIKDMQPEDPLIDIKRQQVFNVVREAAERIGLKGKCILNPETGKKHYVHPHSFRDSLAVAWLGVSGGDMSMQKALQDHLGHKSFSTTQKYQKLTPTTVKTISDKVRALRFASDEDVEAPPDHPAV
jgi:integrase